MITTFIYFFCDFFQKVIGREADFSSKRMRLSHQVWLATLSIFYYICSLAGLYGAWYSWLLTWWSFVLWLWSFDGQLWLAALSLSSLSSWNHSSFQCSSIISPTQLYLGWPLLHFYMYCLYLLRYVFAIEFKSVTIDWCLDLVLT